MGELKDKVIFITGGSRGIGLAIAKRAAKDGAKIVIASKTTEPHPVLPGTIYTAAKEIEDAGGQCLPLQMDIRSEEEIEKAVDKTVEHFGHLDILINNASAIHPTRTLDTPAKRYDLMMQVNQRGTFLTSQKCLPHLLKSKNPHILTLCPPFDMHPDWLAGSLAYTMAKYGMTLVTKGLAKEFEGQVAVNALWPKTAIATEAIRMVMGDEAIQHCRTPEIMADAAHIVLKQNKSYTDHFLIDEDLLREHGVQDFDVYAVNKNQELHMDGFTRNPPTDLDKRNWKGPTR